MSDTEFDAALDLLRRTDPRQITANLNAICKSNPDLAEDLLAYVDQPLTLKTDSTNGKQFLCCDYNRDADSHRSPFSNKYFPELEDGIYPSQDLRNLEEVANQAFDVYRELYYEGGITSTYFWDNEGLTGVTLFKKKVSNSSWDSIHVFECDKLRGECQYKLTSTIILDIAGGAPKGSQQGSQQGPPKSAGSTLSGQLTRQLERQFTVVQDSDHVKHLGMMIEELENRMRALLKEVYFGKTRDILGDIRSLVNLADLKLEETNEREIADALNRRQSTE